MSKDEFSIVQSQDGLLSDVRIMIEQARDQVAQAVNVGMTLLCWRIGARIRTEVLRGERADYGKEIVSTLSPSPTSRPAICSKKKLHAAIETSRARLDALGEEAAGGVE